VQKLSGKRVSMAGAVGHGVWAFLKHYLFKHGYRDGWAGFVIALGNFEGTFYRYAKRYEDMKAWAPPASPPLRRPDAPPAAPARPAPTSDGDNGTSPAVRASPAASSPDRSLPQTPTQGA